MKIQNVFDQTELQQRHLGIAVAQINAVTFDRVDIDLFANKTTIADKAKIKFFHSDPMLKKMIERDVKRKNAATGEYFNKFMSVEAGHTVTSALITTRAMDQLRNIVNNNGFDKSNPAYVNSVAEYKHLLGLTKTNPEYKDGIVSLSTLKTSNFQAVEAGENNKVIENTCLVVMQLNNSYVATLRINNEVYEFDGAQVLKDKLACNLKWRLDQQQQTDETDMEW